MKKNKIFIRICIGVVATTILSSTIVSSLFGKYISSGNADGKIVYPYAFGVEVTGLEMDKITVNFARDGAPATPLGYFTETISVPFTVKAAPYNEIATEVSVSFTFNTAFSNLIRKASTNRYDEGVCCDYSVLGPDGNIISGIETGKSGTGAITWTPSSKQQLAVNGELEYILQIDVHNATLMDRNTTGERYEFITDAITVDVTATQKK